MSSDAKYCKVTVHQTITTTVPPSLIRRQTVGVESLGSYQRRRPVLPSKANVFAVYDAHEVFIDDTADIAVLSEDEPLVSSRRRAHTTASLSTSARLSNILNPLSRMTMRWTDQLADDGAHKAMASSTTSACTTPEVMESPTSFLAQQPMIDLANSFLDVDTNNSDEIVRPTIEELGSLLAGTPPIPAGVTLDMLPNEHETSPLSPYLRDILLHNQFQQRALSRLVFESSDDGGDSDKEIEDDDASSTTTDEYRDDVTSHSVDIDSIRQTRQEAAANFKSSLLDLDRLKPHYCTTKALRRVGGSARNVRELSSPRMTSQVTRPRKATVPDRGETIATLGPHVPSHEVPSVSMYHGQELHLAFKTTMGQTTQVQGHPKRRRKSHRNPFSRRVRCHAVESHDALDESDTLRIIGHTTDGLLCGGDCVSLARTDGMVLRMQKMSKKLTFSNKSDVRAQFIITGVPDRTPVTSTSKFYLQSMYDRNRTVGYLPSRRVNNPGCLAMYVHRNTEDKVEPVQFFQRTPSNSLGAGTARNNACA